MQLLEAFEGLVDLRQEVISLGLMLSAPTISLINAEVPLLSKHEDLTESSPLNDFLGKTPDGPNKLGVLTDW